MEPDLEGSETADDEEETVKPLGQISPHFESGAATNIWVTQLGVRLNLTADQVRITNTASTCVVDDHIAVTYYCP